MFVNYLLQVLLTGVIKIDVWRQMIIGNSDCASSRSILRWIDVGLLAPNVHHVLNDSCDDDVVLGVGLKGFNQDDVVHDV